MAAIGETDSVPTEDYRGLLMNYQGLPPHYSVPVVGLEQLTLRFPNDFATHPPEVKLTRPLPSPTRAYRHLSAD